MLANEFEAIGYAAEEEKFPENLSAEFQQVYRAEQREKHKDRLDEMRKQAKTRFEMHYYLWFESTDPEVDERGKKSIVSQEFLNYLKFEGFMVKVDRNSGPTTQTRYNEDGTVKSKTVTHSTPVTISWKRR